MKVLIISGTGLIITHGDGSSPWAACHRDDVGQAFAEAVGNEKTFGK